MRATAELEARVRAQVKEELRLLQVLEQARLDPKALINEIRFFDPTTNQWIEFKMFPPKGWVPVDLDHGPALDWYWQSQIVEWWQDPAIKRYLILKARQLGITLLACAYALWLMLFQPGSASVAFSYEEGEARKLVEASWMMFQSLPPILKQHVEVVTPKMAELPTEFIRLKHADGLISTFQAMPATEKHGHGGRLTWAILDEFARQQYGESVFTAINPAIGRGNAKLAVISTANGVGDFFHTLWREQKQRNIAAQFLPWNLEPTRNEKWYAENAMALGEVERNQQYPLTPDDAFMLSGNLYFDSEALAFYRTEVAKPLHTGQYVLGQRGMFTHTPSGCIEVYEKPRTGVPYAIGVDTATGRGTDYTVGTVLDLTSGAIVAVLRAKIEAPLAATQLYWLGRTYNKAKIAVERQGGYGEAIIIALRDGSATMPAYPNLYRHVKYTRGDRPISEEFGHPMGPTNRGALLDSLKALIRERFFPWMPEAHMGELGSFIYRDKTPSPAAADNCNDDCVMSLALVAEMYRQFGQRPDPVRRKWKKREYVPHPSRQH